jgi:hypothetical protein
MTKKNFRNERLNGGFITKPGDVLTIIIEKGVVSSSITFELSNKSLGEFYHRDSLPNSDKAWNFLKQLNEVGNRTVLVYNEGENQTVPFEESAPYIYRFNR